MLFQSIFDVLLMTCSRTQWKLVYVSIGGTSIKCKLIYGTPAIIV